MIVFDLFTQIVRPTFRGKIRLGAVLNTCLICWLFKLLKLELKIKWWKTEYAGVMCIQQLYLFILLIANFIDMINHLVVLGFRKYGMVQH